MRWIRVLGWVPLVAGVDDCQPPVPVDPAAIAFAHAPVHYQDTDDSYAIGDYLTAVDYDGNWDSLDNWQNLEDPGTWTTGTDAYVYQSVVESCTHWFVMYLFYHPRDWTDAAHALDSEHENDTEGVLAVVRKDGSPTGHLEAMVTLAHNDFYSFTPADSPYVDGGEDIDGTVTFTEVDGVFRPMTSQEARGHGIKAWPYAGDFAGNAGEDGITYLPGTTAETPPSGDSRDVRYALADLYVTLWPLQVWGVSPYDGNWGSLQGDNSHGCGDGLPTCPEDAAGSPWSFLDEDDGVVRGALAMDPARLVEEYFDGLGDFSRYYVSNRYLSDLRVYGFTDAAPPMNFPSDFSLDDAYTYLDPDCSQTPLVDSR